MCFPQICLKDDWEPRLKRNYSPPRGGWTITQIPDSLEEDLGDQFATLSWAWRNRPFRTNSNWNNAISEMTDLLKYNGTTITKELRAKIRFDADREWCAREPARCSKQDSPMVMQAMRSSTPVDEVPMKAVKATKTKAPCYC